MGQSLRANLGSRINQFVRRLGEMGRTDKAALPRLGALLIQQRLITNVILDAALKEQALAGGKLGEILVAQGVITRVQLAKALRYQHHYLAAVAVFFVSMTHPVMAKAQTDSSRPGSAMISSMQMGLLPSPDEMLAAPLLASRSGVPLTASLAVHHSLKPKIALVLPLVRASASEFDVPQELILAVIHTESTFAPRVVSSASAYGLMQLIPRFGGADAYEHMHGLSGTPSTEFLQDPANNIRMGAAYLKVLGTRYFGHINNQHIRDASVIVAYNLGPTRLLQLYARHGVPGSLAALTAFVAKYTPRETIDYLSRVTKRSEIYRAISTPDYLASNI